MPTLPIHFCVNNIQLKRVGDEYFKPNYMTFVHLVSFIQCLKFYSQVEGVGEGIGTSS